MKKLILTLLFALMSIITFGVIPANIYTNEIQFTKIVVETPCRVAYGVADSTCINIRNTEAYGLYYEIKDSILYIKPDMRLDEILNYNIKDIPLIRIFNKDVMPIITTSSSLYICERTTHTKKQALNNGTTSLVKN